MATHPDLIERACGGWLATTPDGESLRLGAVGATAEEAAAAYERERALWLQILARVAAGDIGVAGDRTTR